MSKRIELAHTSKGFHPGNAGSAVLAYVQTHDDERYISLTTRYAVDFAEDKDGWLWAPTTRLDRQQATQLRDFLTSVLEES